MQPQQQNPPPISISSQIQQDRLSPKPSQNSQQSPKNDSNLLSVSQASCHEKQEKQSSNDGLNSQRSYPSSMLSQNNNEKRQAELRRSNIKKTQRKYLQQGKNIDQEDNISEEDSRLQYSPQHNRKKTSLSLLKIFFIICKLQYFFEIIRIFLYAIISITIFAYVLDQNKEKKQFYQAFYSSQQITISKQINGVFPPLFGQQFDIVNHTWVLQNYKSNHLMEQPDQAQQKVHTSSQLLFEFKKGHILYIRPNDQKCAQQLKFKWKIFDYNMKISEVLESDFQKIQEDEASSCFGNKKIIAQKMRQISIWTIDWQSKQLYLLTQPFWSDSSEPNNVQKWNQLIVLKKIQLSI